MKRQIGFYKKFNKIEGEEILKTIKVDILIGNIETILHVSILADGMPMAAHAIPSNINVINIAVI